MRLAIGGRYLRVATGSIAESEASQGRIESPQTLVPPDDFERLPDARADRPASDRDPDGLGNLAEPDLELRRDGFQGLVDLRRAPPGQLAQCPPSRFEQPLRLGGQVLGGGLLVQGDAIRKKVGR